MYNANFLIPDQNAEVTPPLKFSIIQGPAQLIFEVPSHLEVTKAPDYNLT